MENPIYVVFKNHLQNNFCFLSIVYTQMLVIELFPFLRIKTKFWENTPRFFKLAMSLTLLTADIKFSLKLNTYTS